MSTNTTFDNSTEGYTDANGSGFTSDAFVMTLAENGGYIFSFNVLTDGWSGGPTQADILQNGVVRSSGYFYSTGAIEWHNIVISYPFVVSTGDTITIRHTSLGSYRIYSSAVCTPHAAAVAKFDVVVMPSTPAGLVSRYYSNTTMLDPMSFETVDQQVDFFWNTPPHSLPAAPYSTCWTGWVTPNFSEGYTFKLTLYNCGGRLFINNRLVIDSWGDAGNPGYDVTSSIIYFSASTPYPIRVEFNNPTAVESNFILYWSSISVVEEIIPQAVLSPIQPTLGTGLLGNYVNTYPNVQLLFSQPKNTDTLGPNGTRTDGPIDFAWGTGGTGLSGVYTDYFCVRWEGWLDASLTGTYTITATHRDGCRIFLDELDSDVDTYPHMIVNSWGDGLNTTTSSGISLVAGVRRHIWVFYYLNGSSSQISLSWQSGDAPVATQIIPFANMYTTELGATNGLLGSYFNSYPYVDVLTLTADQITALNYMHQRTDAQINFNWDTAGPGVIDPPNLWTDGTRTVQSPYPYDNYFYLFYTVEWRGWWRSMFTEVYTFRMLVTDGVRLWIGDELVIDAWTHGLKSAVGTKYIVGGRYYPIRIQYNDSNTHSIIQFYTSTPLTPEILVPASELFLSYPLSGNGSHVQYWNTLTPAGPADYSNIKSNINFGPGDVPGPTITTPFTTFWTGYIRPDYTETYTLYLTSAGGALLSLDNTTIILDQSQHNTTTDSTTYAFEAGKFYKLFILFTNDGARDTIKLQLEWSSATVGAQQTVPGANLFADAPPGFYASLASLSPENTPGDGVWGQYYSQPAPLATADLTVATDGSGAGFTFATAWPPAPIPSAFFSAVWTGYFMPRITGSHTFTLTGVDYARLYIDSAITPTTPVIVLDFSGNGISAPIPLQALAQHRIRVEYMCLNGPGSVSLTWESSYQRRVLIPPAALYSASGAFANDAIVSGTGNGINGTYYNTIDFSGTPGLQRIDASGVAFNFGTASPGGTVPAGVFSVLWSGNLDVPATATYTFYVVTQYGCQLFVDNAVTPIIDASGSPGYHTGTVALTSSSGGVYPTISMYYTAQGGGNQFAFMSWSGGSLPWTLTPGDRLYAGVGNGLAGQYYNASMPNSLPVVERIDQTINMSWPSGAPWPGVAAEYFSVVWTGWIRPRYTTTYQFTLDISGGEWARLFIDSTYNPSTLFATPIIDFSTGGSYTASMAVVQNDVYPMRIELLTTNTGGYLNFKWFATSYEPLAIVPMICLFDEHPTSQISLRDISGLPVGKGSGLIGSYYSNQTWTPPAALTRVDESLAFNWGSGGPGGGVSADFSATWTGFIQPRYSETYTFYAIADDGIIVDISSSIVINDLSNTALQSGTVSLLENVIYPITVTYRDVGGLANIYMAWRSQQQTLTIVPRTRLFTALGTGLRGQYFDAIAPNGPAVVDQIDTTVDFLWTGPPVVGLPATFYSVVWTGYIKPLYSETYTLTLFVNGWARLWINDTIIARFNDFSQVAVAFVANDFYSIKIEFIQVGAATTNMLILWQSTTQGLEVIPELLMFPDLSGVNTADATVHGTAAPINYTVPYSWGDGLNGYYFGTDTPTGIGSAAVQTVDPAVQFNWAVDPLPGDLSGSTTYSAIWSGYLTPTVSASYYFYIVSEGAIRLVVNGTTVVDRQTGGGPPDAYDDAASALTPISLTAGTSVTFTFTYSHLPAAVPSYVYIAWGIVGGEALTLIPATVLYSTVGDGVIERYYDARGSEGLTSGDSILPTINVSYAVPPVGITNTYYYLVYTSWVKPNTTETYTFYMTSSDKTRMEINGVLWKDFDISGTASIPMVSGTYYHVRIETLVLDATAGTTTVELEWESAHHVRTVIPQISLFSVQPVSLESSIEEAPVDAGGTGLLVDYWVGASIGTPDLSGTDAWVIHDWNTDPVPGIPLNNFSARWTGFLLSEYTDIYTFYITTSARARLYIDGNLIVDASGVGTDVIFSGTAGLLEGYYHEFQVDFSDGSGALVPLTVIPQFLRVAWWSAQNQAFAAVPFERLFQQRPRSLPARAAGLTVGLGADAGWSRGETEGSRTRAVDIARISCGVSDVLVTITTCPPEPVYPGTGLHESQRIAQQLAACTPYKGQSKLNSEAISSAIARVRNRDLTQGALNPAGLTTIAKISTGCAYVGRATGIPASAALTQRLIAISTCATEAAITKEERFAEWYPPVPPNPLVVQSTQRGAIVSQPGAQAIQTCLPNPRF